MLSFVGEEGNTDCAGHLMHVDWSRGGPHPMSYTPEDINVDRIKDLRIRWNCHAQSALQYAFLTSGTSPPPSSPGAVCTGMILS